MYFNSELILLVGKQNPVKRGTKFESSGTKFESRVEKVVFPQNVRLSCDLQGSNCTGDGFNRRKADVALLKLKVKLDWTNSDFHVAPVCLGAIGEIFTHTRIMYTNKHTQQLSIRHFGQGNQSAIVSGWGSHVIQSYPVDPNWNWTKFYWDIEDDPETLRYENTFLNWCDHYMQDYTDAWGLVCTFYTPRKFSRGPTCKV